MLSVNISFTGLANVLIAGMVSISNRFNAAYYTKYRRIGADAITVRTEFPSWLCKNRTCI
jgi:hypothetical protein